MVPLESRAGCLPCLLPLDLEPVFSATSLSRRGLETGRRPTSCLLKLISTANPWNLGRRGEQSQACFCLVTVSRSAARERVASLARQRGDRETSVLAGAVARAGGREGEGMESGVRHTAAGHKAPPLRSASARRRCGRACPWASCLRCRHTRVAGTRAAAARASAGRPWSEAAAAVLRSTLRATAD